MKRINAQTRQHILGASIAAALLVIFTLATGFAAVTELAAGAMSSLGWLGLAAAGGVAIVATYKKDSDTVNVVLEVACSSGDIIQLRDGRAALVLGLRGTYAIGDTVACKVNGIVNVAKTASIVILDGGKAYFDHSASAAHFKTVNDRDFYLGVAYGDAASADTTMDVDLNVQPNYILDVARDETVSVTVGTQALGGFLPPQRFGGAHKFAISATNEAQKLDILTREGFAKGANAIVEFKVNVISDGAGTATDVSIGVANGTHATDFDSVTDSILLHLDGNDASLLFESDDGTTEVAAADSSTTYTEGTPFEIWMDMRNPADVQIYSNGVLMLPSTVFNVDASTATWKLVAHVEKTASTDTYELDLAFLRARLARQ